MDELHAQLSRQMLKLCWIYARSGALDERLRQRKPVPARPGKPGLRYDDLRLEVFGL